MSDQRFVAEPVLAQLKDFQRASVEHVFERLYHHGSDRFLVADEVGLGKTMVARGLIAKAIEHLWDDVARIDVIYICSNASIAQQNIRRLNVMPDQGFSFSTRMTLIARQLSHLAGNKVNFVSFTPGTSFDLKSSTGMSDERVLLYWLLRHLWGDAALNSRGAQRLLKCGVSDANWPRQLRHGKLTTDDVDPTLLDGFGQDLIEINARERFEAIAPAFAFEGAATDDAAMRAQRDELVGDLRLRLATRCVDSLEPDLVILDEFQRFRELMSGDHPAGQLATSLFDYPGNHTVFLSATPYKMYTNRGDEGEDHHNDFIGTLDSLAPGTDGAHSETVTDIIAAMAEFRSALLDIGHRTVDDLVALRQRVETELSKVMVRTERLGAGHDRNGMLTPCEATAPLDHDEVVAFVGLDAAARAVGSPGMMEYWKSVPHFINFCDGYKVDDRIDAALADPTTNSDTRQRLEHVTDRIDWTAWRRFGSLDSNNGRLAVLRKQTIAAGAWRMLWLAPSLPYHSLGVPWSDGRQTFTKRLIFSTWAGVPKSVSSLLSYEAEAAMFALRPEPIENTPEARRTIRSLLTFRRDRDGHPGSMNSLSFVYPSPTLARIADPLAIARERGAALALDEMRAEVRSRIEVALAQAELAVEVDEDQGPHAPDQRWYWAAPILLDRVTDAAPWMAGGPGDVSTLVESWVGESSTDGRDDGDVEPTSHDILDDHVGWAQAVYRGEVALGRRPDDLVDVLVDLALGAPGTVALRSIDHVLGERMSARDRWVGACRIGWGFRSLFSLPEVNSMIRSVDWEQEYWRSAIAYCADGCLTAVLDEYLHVVRESIGLFEIDEADPLGDMLTLADAVADAIGIRTTSLVARDHLDEADTTPRFRTRFAMRFGNDRTETEASVVTATAMRRAFNSPFWPFVLTSTSIGQEGLDFHLYCHAIMHWNLPSNPVDLEQREGRVHRYKGHAVRRNVATSMATAAWESSGDPWEAMFDAAASARHESLSELNPYWVYPGDAKIERHVPMLPLSAEIGQLARLKRDVARYRSVFGQARQDDLLEFLGDVPQAKLDAIRIDLSPPG